MNLDDLRTQMNGINREIAQLIKKRLMLAMQIAEVKKEQNLSVEDLARESQQRASLAKIASELEIDEGALCHLFDDIVEWSKVEMERRMRS